MGFRNSKLALITSLTLLVIIPISSAFSVTGSILKTEVAPGQEVVHVMTVKNDEDAPTLNLTAEVFGFGISPTGGNILFSSDEDNSSYSARPFLTVTPNSFSLGPGESREVILEGNIPGDVGAGGRYAIVDIKTKPMGKSDVGVITAIDVPIMLTIKGSELIETGEITDLGVLGGDDGLDAQIMFENTGNHHYKASSKAVIEDKNRKIVAEATTPLEASSILPTNMRQFKIQLGPKANLAPGTYTIKVSVVHENGTVLDTKETILKV